MRRDKLPDIQPYYYRFSEYIEGQPDDKKVQLERYKDISEFITAHLHRQFQYEGDFPEIRITSSDSQNAAASPYCVDVTQGLIEHCLSIRTPSITLFFPLFPAELWSDEMAGTIHFAWVVAHEYVHVGRRHESVKDETQDLDQNLVSQAFEHDADLCAAAAVYRWLQQKFPVPIEQNLDIRAAVCFGLYWSIRTMQVPAEQCTHADANARLFHICYKMASMSFGREQPDLTFENPITGMALSLLTKLMVNSDLAYKEYYNPDHPVMAADWFHKGQSRYMEVVTMWNELIRRFEWFGR